MTNIYDALVVGGGAAGLSAALVLARARRTVLVVDAGRPRNAPAEHLHGFLSRDGVAPADLLAFGQAEVAGYGGEIRTGTVTRIEHGFDGFRAQLGSSGPVYARAVLLAGGGSDELPAITGLREHWGRGVAHCPYCHGYEVRDQPIGVIATGPWAVHQALLLRQWSGDVMLFTHRHPDLDDADWARLGARGISVVDGVVDEVLAADDHVTGVRLESGREFARTALFVGPYFRATVPAGLDLETASTEAASFVVSDATGRTGVAGVWAAGNVTDPMAQVIIAAAAGSRAGADINGFLMEADIELAQELARPFSGRAEAANCERVLGDRRHGLG